MHIAYWEKMLEAAPMSFSIEFLAFCRVVKCDIADGSTSGWFGSIEPVDWVRRRSVDTGIRIQRDNFDSQSIKSLVVMQTLKFNYFEL